MKKLKLKKSVIHFLFVIPFIVIISWFLLSNIKLYKLKQYKENYENELIMHGYNLEEAKELIKIFSDEQLDNILIKEKNSIIIDFAKEKYFIFDNLNRYINYYNSHSELVLNNIISLVNVNRDYDFYTNDIPSNTSLLDKILVNKYYFLDSNYTPDNLVTISTQYAHQNNQITSKANDAYIEMWQAAKNDGYQLIVNSGYRSYESQEDLYNSYVQKYGEIETVQLAAKPGYSEHQTGLAIDVFEINNQLTSTFKNSEAYSWLKDNAYLYGYIERYPENKEDITGYDAEAWHWRYVGKKAAKIIYEENITLDEYYAYYIKN